MSIKLSDHLKYWRVERPDEWIMDEFIRSAEKIEQFIQRCENIYYAPPLDLPPQCNTDMLMVLREFKELLESYKE